MTRYVVGQTVRVRPDLKVGGEHNKYFVTKEMLQFAGNKYKIRSCEITREGQPRYTLEGCSRGPAELYWTWSDKSFVPVKKKRKQPKE